MARRARRPPRRRGDRRGLGRRAAASLPGRLTINEAAAGRPTLIAVVNTVALGALVLVPSLILLFSLFLRGRLDAGRVAAPVIDAPSTRPPDHTRPRLGFGLACLVVGAGLMVLADSSWAHVAGITCLCGFAGSAFHKPTLQGVTARFLAIGPECRPLFVFLRKAPARITPSVDVHVLEMRHACSDPFGGRDSTREDRSMLGWLVGTHGDVAPLVLRLTLAAVMFPHGAQKALGWFGGSGFRGSIDFLRKSGVASPVAVLAIMAEFIGPLALAIGLFTRVAALGIAAVMMGAILTVHGQHGFFMNWYGNQQGEGFEYHVLVIGLAVALVLSGAGVWSLDALIAGH